VKSYAATIAADIREAVRNAKDANKLHALPAGARVTVRSESGSMYSCVGVTIANGPATWAWKGGNVDARALTPEATQVVNRLGEAGATAAAGRGWGEVQIAAGDHRITVGQSWAPDTWRPGQD
jgi:hypothetical protein